MLSVLLLSIRFSSHTVCGMSRVTVYCRLFIRIFFSLWADIIWFVCVLGRNICKCLQSTRTFAFSRIQDCYDLIISSRIRKTVRMTRISWICESKHKFRFAHTLWRFKINSVNNVLKAMRAAAFQTDNIFESKENWKCQFAWWKNTWVHEIQSSKPAYKILTNSFSVWKRKNTVRETTEHTTIANLWLLIENLDENKSTRPE